MPYINTKLEQYKEYLHKQRAAYKISHRKRRESHGARRKEP